MACREQRECEVRLRAPRGALSLGWIGAGGSCTDAPVLLTRLLQRLLSSSFKVLGCCAVSSDTSAACMLVA
jgi:hypothetical protein